MINMVYSKLSKNFLLKFFYDFTEKNWKKKSLIF